MMNLRRTMKGKSPTSFGIGLAFATGAMALSTPARAQIAPAVQGSTSSSSSGGPYVQKTISASGIYTTSSTGLGLEARPGYGVGSTNVIIDTVGRSITASSSSTGHGWGPASADSEIQVNYYFKVNGPTPTVAIDISAIATLARSAFDFPLNPGEPGPTQGQYISVTILDDLRHGIFSGLVTSTLNSDLRRSAVFAGGFVNMGAGTTPIDEAFFGTFQMLKTGTIDTGRTYSIEVILQDNVGLGQYARDPDRTISSYSSVSDIGMSINSAFAAADYRIDFGGDSAVPEPASWAMFIGGFGLMGAGMRRRQGSPATA